MYLVQERVTVEELKPGDLVAVESLARIATDMRGPVNIIPAPGAVAFGILSVRTEVPLRGEDRGTVVYRVTVKDELPPSDAVKSERG